MTDTSAPKYKEAIELMASEIAICVDKEDDPLRKVFILGQGDYPTGYQIVESTASEIRKLRRALSDETAKAVALTAERDALASALIAIKHYRKSCHDHDDDMGHDRRDFNKEDLILMETMASSVLKAFSIPESTP